MCDDAAEMAAEAEILQLIVGTRAKLATSQLEPTKVVPKAAAQIEARLPKIEISKFGGKIQQWNSFIQIFTAVIDEREDMSEILKFQYLRGSLTGDALRLIESLEISSENYKKALKMLKERYEDEGVVVNAYLTELWALPSSKESSQELKRLLDSVVSTRASLEARGYLGEKLVDAMFVHFVISRLDAKSREA